MRLQETPIPGVLRVEHEVHPDLRGHFVETWHRGRMAAAGIGPDFVQDNLARSLRGVLRGLHLQVDRPQGKLVTVLVGEVWDVVVDLRPSSPTFGRWTGLPLRAEGHETLWIPPGLAHGYYVVSEEALVAYKVTDERSPAGERVLAWDDPTLAVRWPLIGGQAPILSERDRAGLSLEALLAG